MISSIPISTSWEEIMTAMSSLLPYKISDVNANGWIHVKSIKYANKVQPKTTEEKAIS